MKKTLLLIAALAICGAAVAKSGGSHSSSSTHSSSHSSGSSHSVAGHTMKNGIYVQPHHATNPNDTKRDNWSHKGNVNPHTGKPGTKD
ncbi:hypothetical protein [Acidovorax sp.]|uniref:hypothetical protein n=1 Tax=Acidovorax sp. TaxID=1872122 RepID=UPI003D047549